MAHIQPQNLAQVYSISEVSVQLIGQPPWLHQTPNQQQKGLTVTGVPTGPIHKGKRVTSIL